MTYTGPERRESFADFVALKVKVEHLERSVTEMRDDIKGLLALANQTKGGWKVIVLVGSVSGAVGALLAKVVPLLPR